MKQLVKDNQIGVMSVVHEGRKPFGKQTYFFEDMVKNGGVDTSQIFFFSPLDWNENSAQVNGFKFISNEWREAKESIPKLIYDRAFSRDERQKSDIELFRSFLKKSDAVILNPFILADLLNNKVEFHNFLQDHNIATLGTYPFSVLMNDHFFDTIGNRRVYVKPTFGSKGEGIYVIEKTEDKYLLIDKEGRVESFGFLNKLMDALQDNIDSEERYFVQIEANTELYKNAPFDIRVLVQNYGKDCVVTGKAIRIGQKKSITSNLNSGGSALPVEELEEFFDKNYMYSIEELHLNIEKLCLDCSKALKNAYGNFCEIGFDILITKDKGPIIIEGNAKPSRWVFVKIADFLELNGRDNSYYLERRKETVSVPLKYASYLLNK